MFLKALSFAFYPYDSLWINLCKRWSFVRSHPLIFLNMHMSISSSIHMDRQSFLSWIALYHCQSYLTISILRYCNTTQQQPLGISTGIPVKYMWQLLKNWMLNYSESMNMVCLFINLLCVIPHMFSMTCFDGFLPMNCIFPFLVW